MRQFDPAKLSWDANETELKISLKNGSSIWFKGSDAPDTLFGEDVYAAVIDEATRCKEESWHAVRSTLTATGGPVKIIGNVRGRKNWAYMLARRAQQGEQGMAYFKLTAFDAVEGGILPMSEIEDAKRTLPDHVFKELYLAEPGDDGGNPFGIGAIEKCYSDLSDDPAVCFGVDLAKSVDWTVVCGLDAEGHVSELERWQSDWGQTISRIARIVGRTPTLVDATGVGDPIVEELSRLTNGVEAFKFTSNSKQQLMEGLASSIHQQSIGFPKGWLTDELETFEYEYTKTGVRYTAPEGLHDDGVCALALANRKFHAPKVSVNFAFKSFSVSG